MTKQDKGFRKRHWKHEAHRRLSHHKHVLSVKIANCKVKLRFMDIRLTESSYVFSKFNPLNTDTQLIIKRTLFMAPQCLY